jgi:hypothetical protein
MAAARCFCGCGRKVRFTLKKSSEWGAETDKLLGRLRLVSGAEMLKGRPDVAAKLNGFIEEGEWYRSMWLEITHATPFSDRTPYPGPTTSGEQIMRDAHDWRRKASLLLVAELKNNLS